MATLNVGAGQTCVTLSAAFFASLEGDVIAMQAGAHVNGLATISKDITIVAASVRGNSKAAQSCGTATVDLHNRVIAHG